MFSTGHLLHCRSMMMMMSSQLRLIWILQKSLVPSLLLSFKLPCLHQNYLLLLALTAFRLQLYGSKTIFYILLINRRRCSVQNTTFHLNGSIRLLCLFPKSGLHYLDNQRGIARSCAISKPRNKIIFLESSR